MAFLAVPAAAMRTADDVSTKINQTGRTLPMTVTLRDSSRQIGEVLIRIMASDAIRISKLSLEQAIGGELISGTLARLKAEGDDLSIEDLKRIGLNISFDREALELVIGFKPEQRKTGDISLAARPALRSGTLAAPAAISGYLNLGAQADFFWDSSDAALRFDIGAVARLGNVVFESEFVFQNGINGQLCPNNAFCAFGHSSGLKRQGSRIVYDWPEYFNRLTIGDTRSAATFFQSTPDVAGISLEHSTQKLAPGEHMRTTGSKSLVLERASIVEVIINGAMVQRLNLPPGPYNLRDLPLRPGSNDVTLLITDEVGGKKTVRLDAYASHQLLAEGKSEWALSGGVPSYMLNNEVIYREDEFIGSGFWRYGLQSDLTIEAHVQADTNVAMGGGGALFATAFGVWGVHLAASRSNAGVGGALRFTWDIAGADNIDALRLDFEAHSSAYRAPGQFAVPLDGIVYPAYHYSQSFAATYTRQLPDNWQLTVSGRYDVADSSLDHITPFAVRGDRYHADLSLAHPLSDTMTISGIVGYSNEIYGRAFRDGIAGHFDDTTPEWWVGLRLFWRPDQKTMVTASSDTLNQRSYVSGNYYSGQGLGAWSTTIAASDDRNHGSGSLTGAVRYQGQRAELGVSQSASTVGFAPDGTDTVVLTQPRTSVRVDTAIVFADGHAAVSAPVRGEGGFAILYPHASLKEKEITSGSIGAIRAQSDALGPAVVTNLPAYLSQTLAVDAADLPLGYSLGDGGFDVRAPYRGGYALEVGSGYSVIAFGVLVNARGEPLALVGGTASNGKKSVSVFTNQSGRFAADGLAAGRWRVAMETDEGRLNYSIDVPEGTKGLIRLGTLSPGPGANALGAVSAGGARAPAPPALAPGELRPSILDATKG